MEQRGLEVPEIFQKAGEEKEVKHYVRLFELGEFFIYFFGIKSNFCKINKW